jgi:charged multivesicular body protein 1
MDKFEVQFSDLDIQTSYMKDAMGFMMTMSIMHQMLEDTNTELRFELQQNHADKDVPS